MKTLQDILYKVGIEGISGKPSVTVSSLSYDSRTVQQGGLYIAQKGTQLDGHDFIYQAIENGAHSIVCESLPKKCKKGSKLLLEVSMIQA